MARGSINKIRRHYRFERKYAENEGSRARLAQVVSGITLRKTNQFGWFYATWGSTKRFLTQVEV